MEQMGSHAAPRLRVVTYIVENAVRDGLADCALDYPFWGSTVWTREEIVARIDRAFHRSNRRDPAAAGAVPDPPRDALRDPPRGALRDPLRGALRDPLRGG